MDIGAVHDLMIHDIDLVLSLAGSHVERVEAIGICIVGGREDCVQARLTLANGCIADLTANRVCPDFRRTLQVWSEAGCVLADLHQREVTAYRPGAALLAGELPFELGQRPGADIAALKAEMFSRFITVEKLPASNADALTAELASFVDAVRNHRRPEVDGNQALAALDVAERILACVAEYAWDGAAGGRIGPHAHQIHGRRKAA
jgi:predicted dehydrogenase